MSPALVVRGIGGRGPISVVSPDGRQVQRAERPCPRGQPGLYWVCGSWERLLLCPLDSCGLLPSVPLESPSSPGGTGEERGVEKILELNRERRREMQTEIVRDREMEMGLERERAGRERQTQRNKQRQSHRKKERRGER